MFKSNEMMSALGEFTRMAMNIDRFDTDVVDIKKQNEEKVIKKVEQLSNKIIYEEIQ